MVLINIHLEGFDKESFEGVKKLAEKGPIAISFAPIQIPLIKDNQINYLKDLFKQKEYVLGQQGLTHKCNKCIRYQRTKNQRGIGPHHENYCLWFGEISDKEQEKFMKEGRKKLKKLFGKEPELYVPPNHLSGENTIKVAEKLGYKWITDKAYIPLKPYRYKSITIIPESKPELRGSNQIYFHGDRNVLNKLLGKKLISLYDLKPSKRSNKKVKENRKLKIISKIERDLVKGFYVKKAHAQKLAELIYGSKFINSSIY